MDFFSSFISEHLNKFEKIYRDQTSHISKTYYNEISQIIRNIKNCICEINDSELCNNDSCPNISSVSLIPNLPKSFVKNGSYKFYFMIKHMQLQFKEKEGLFGLIVQIKNKPDKVILTGIIKDGFFEIRDFQTIFVTENPSNIDFKILFLNKEGRIDWIKSDSLIQYGSFNIGINNFLN